MTRSLSRWQALLLGGAVLVGLTLASVGLFAMGSRQWLWGDNFQLCAGFRQIHGVEVGTRVRVLGREAGEVIEVVLPESPSGDVLLRMRIDGKLRPLIRADACAQVVAEGMVGGRVVEIHPGSDVQAPIADNALIASKASSDLTDALAQAGDVLSQANLAIQDIREGKGTLGKLMKNDEIYQEAVKSVKQGQKTLSTMNQNLEAIKRMPVVRSYVTDLNKELIRPECSRDCRSLAEAELFEPGAAILTASGRQRLDGLVPWLEGMKHSGSEVVIVACSHPGRDPEVAHRLTEEQSKAVCEYLTNQHAVQKMGWFSRRKVKPLGCGVDTPPGETDEKSPPAPRVDVVVFVPRN